MADSKLTYEFGPFRLDAVKRLLTRNGEAVPLTPKAFDILVALIEEPGKTIDKDLLIRKVWQDCIVEEGNLTFNIHKLRRALGEGPKEHRYILTIPGKGYRFVADVTQLLNGTGADTDQHRLGRDAANLEARHAYLRGVYYWDQRTEDGVRKAIEHFELAIEADPAYALAYSGLADSFSLLSFYGQFTPEEAFPRAKAAAVRALAIDESLAEAHASLAYVHLYYDWEWQAAESEFKRSIELKADYPTAHHWYHEYLSLLGRYEEAAVEIKLAHDLDPLSPPINAAMALPLLHAADFDPGIQALKRVIALDPDFYRAHLFIGTAYVKKGDFPRALDEISLAVELSHRSPRALAVLGWALGAAGNRKGAEDILSELLAMMAHRYVPAYALAMVNVPLGRFDRAFEWLERAFAERDEWLTRLKIAQELDPLRGDPRFKDLMLRMRFQ